ncbi:hypothetical protein AAVH_38564 [Aphelenchoides avenae]|nr:hypothetical protein AAVH_38564 [Aphelenchus avenae]
MAAFNYPPPQHAAPPPPQQYPQQPPQQHPQQPPQQHPQQPPPAGMYPSPNLPLPPEYAVPAPNAAEKATFNDYPDYALPKNPTPGSATAPQHDDDPDHIYEIPPGEEDLDLMFPEPPKDFAPRPPGNHPSGGGGNGGGNTSGGAGGGPSDLNFDDLAKRFDQLKKRL